MAVDYVTPRKLIEKLPQTAKDNPQMTAIYNKQLAHSHVWVALTNEFGRKCQGCQLLQDGLAAIAYDHFGDPT